LIRNFVFFLMNQRIEFKIGRADTNHLVISHPRVSGHHCLIKVVGDDQYLIEDLGSTNGTIVNGTRILQHLLTKQDEVLLGDFKLNIELVFNLLLQNPLPNSQKYHEVEKQLHVCQEFEKLQAVYEHYVKSKRKTIQGNSLASTGIRAGLSLVPVVGAALGTLATGAMGNVQVKLMEIEEQYKKDYICPACFKFLGAEPFENLSKRGYCSYCKAKWRS
jgi:hypothetical protein